MLQLAAHWVILAVVAPELGYNLTTWLHENERRQLEIVR